MKSSSSDIHIQLLPPLCSVSTSPTNIDQHRSAPNRRWRHNHHQIERSLLYLLYQPQPK
ncbi:hypothetical protein Hanom_Chr15g01373981 [Helianthus anomalus]